MNQRFFVTATGTGIGKSFITAALVRQAKGMWRSVSAFKPVVTGFDPETPDDSDTGLLLRSLEQDSTPENIDRMSPWRFKAALAPAMAALQELREVDFEALVVHSRGAMLAPDELILIEGVGGVMVPLDETHTVLDWIERVEAPVLLVTGSYLGTISHTLTAMAVLQQRHIPIHAIIINESEESPVSLQDTRDELSRWTRLPIIPVTRRKSGEDWQDVKELRSLLA